MARTYRWGVLGTSGIASKFSRQLSTIDRAELAAVGSRTPTRALEFGAEHGFQRTHGSYEALLADPELDAVYIATTTPHHVEHSLAALDRGLPVLLEKPIALNAEQAAQIVARAGQRQVFFMEAMWMRFHPLVQRVRDLAESGELGILRFARAELGWMKDKERVRRPELGRGALLDFGVYPISLSHFLLGTPDRVAAVAVLHASGVDETVSVQLHYPTCSMNIRASVAERLANDASLTGSLGTASLLAPLIDPTGLRVRYRDADRSIASRAMARVSRALRGRELPARIGLRNEALEVMNCLDRGVLQSAVMPWSESVAVMETVDRIRQAY